MHGAEVRGQRVLAEKTSPHFPDLSDAERTHFVLQAAPKDLHFLWLVTENECSPPPEGEPFPSAPLLPPGGSGVCPALPKALLEENLPCLKITRV